MCQFMSTAEMPNRSKNGSNNGNKNQFISMFLKPNKEDEKYRFRLLWYKQSSKNDRNTPYFWQMVHDHWGTTDKGIKIVDDVVICPATKYAHYDEDKYVLNEKTGKKQLNCPICKKAQEAFAAWKFSGYKDKVSMNKFNSLKAKFRACVPVYVVKDPNNDKNNGKLKVIFFTNKEEFEAFDKLVNDEKAKAYIASQNGQGYEIFNGGNAVDFYLRMETVPEVRNAGKQNEYTANVRKITQMAFGKQTHPIESINKDAIDSFAFDDMFYVSNTKEELNMFYSKYYGQDDAPVPEEEIDVFASSTTGAKKTEDEIVTVSNEKEPVEVNEKSSDEKLDDILDEPIETVSPVSEPSVETSDTDDIPNKDEIGAILDDIGV